MVGNGRGTRGSARAAAVTGLRAATAGCYCGEGTRQREGEAAATGTSASATVERKERAVVTGKGGARLLVAPTPIGASESSRNEREWASERLGIATWDCDCDCDL